MALTRARRTRHIPGGATPEMVALPVAANTTLYHGGVAAQNASGFLVPFATAVNLTAVGVVESEAPGATPTSGGIPGDRIVNAGANGAKWANVRRGIFLLDNYASDPVLVSTPPGSVIYGVDDATGAVSSGGSTRSAMGTLWRWTDGSGPGDGHAGIWVMIGVGLGIGAAGPAGPAGHASNAGATLTYTAGDCALTAAQCVDGAVFKVPTDAVNSTITLPTADMPATPVVIAFVADGIANTHTVTYRVGATALTAAATASKRHLATATWSGSAWAVSLSVAP